MLLSDIKRHLNGSGFVCLIAPNWWLKLQLLLWGQLHQSLLWSLCYTRVIEIYLFFLFHLFHGKHIHLHHTEIFYDNADILRYFKAFFILKIAYFFLYLRPIPLYKTKQNKKKETFLILTAKELVLCWCKKWDHI